MFIIFSKSIPTGGRLSFKHLESLTESLEINDHIDLLGMFSRCSPRSTDW